MDKPGKYVLLNRVQNSSKAISKKNKKKNKELKNGVAKVGAKQIKGKNKQLNNVEELNSLTKNQKKKQKQKLKRQNVNSKPDAVNIQKSNKQKNNKSGEKVEVEGKKDFHEDLADRLKASRFRFINEQLYTHTGDEAHEIFNEDSSAFTTYHDGYRKQVEQWPLNPLDRIINSIKKL